MDFSYEQAAGRPQRLIAGVDEAGRGPWAGPVVAAAVILPEQFDISGINDSKKLTPAKRDVLFDHITQHADYAIGVMSASEIDASNILAASLHAMHMAVNALAVTPDHILVDGHQLPDWPYKSDYVIKGDGCVPSIAAASIIAKVTRDRIMIDLDKHYPGYEWASNKGYGTKAHQDGLKRLGVHPQHRKTYAPIRKILEKQNH